MDLKTARKRLTPGTPVIINDIDCPMGKLIAVITRYDTKKKVFRARYLSNSISMIFCYASGSMGFPTPIEDFGVTLEWSDNGDYRAIPSGKTVSAAYVDGKPRKWDEKNPFWNTPKPISLKRLDPAFKDTA